MHKIITVAGKQHNLRIFAKNVAGVSEMLGNKSFMDAVIDSNEKPVENVVPFLWGACQPADATESQFSQDEAYKLFDQLVDDGYAGSDWPKLITDICTVSGFFKPAVAEKLNALAMAMSEALEKASDKMLAKTPRESPSQN